MSGNVYFVMMTTQVVVTFPQRRFIHVIYKYAINGRNTILYILSSVDNLKTKQTLNIEHFKHKHEAKVPCLTGYALNCNANTRLYDSTCTKICEKRPIINEVVQHATGVAYCKVAELNVFRVLLTYTFTT